jgi:hypothetical protein
MLLFSLAGQASIRNTLQRHDTEKSKQIFLGKELLGLSPYAFIHVSGSDLYVPPIGLPILLQKNRWAELGNIWIAHRRVNVEIGTKAAQFLLWESIISNFFAV